MLQFHTNLLVTIAAETRLAARSVSWRQIQTQKPFAKNYGLAKTI
jgi:hypothetical protein